MGALVEPARADLPPEALAKLLLAADLDKVCAAGCRSICLDVAADNAAVSLYQHLGFETEIETRVPFLENTPKIRMHCCLVRPQEPLG